VSRDGGETLGHLLEQIEQFCDRGSSHDQLSTAYARLAQALGDVRGMVSALLEYVKASSDEPTEIYRVGLRAVPFLLSIGDLLIGWLLLWHAEVALGALDAGSSPRDDAFYRGKVTAAVFFAETVLPRLAADRVAVESQSLTAMELDEDAF
jgi:acetyl-CoA dehydrogenase-like protein